MGVIRSMRTRDGRWRVYVYDDHSAELCDDHGRVVLGRVPLHEVGKRLAEEGVGGDDLVADD